MRYALGYLLIVFIFVCCAESTDLNPPVIATFDEDSFCTNDWWNQPANDIIDLHVDRDSVIAFTLYTVHQKTLNLSVQLYPLYPTESRTVYFQTYSDEWNTIDSAKIQDLGWNTHFRVTEWNQEQNTRFRILHGSGAQYNGVIRKDPIHKDSIVMAGLSCNSSRDDGDKSEYVRNIQAIDPDILFFAGDQSYYHRQHTAGWLSFGIQFRELFRSRPAITIPDDHDVGQGNLWGNDGLRCKENQLQKGGYVAHLDYVRMVERTQTSHLPAPYSTDTLLSGITTYYTNLIIGGIELAIVEDRKFKSAPKGTGHPPLDDYILDPNFNPSTVNLPDLQLLGQQQLHFLDNWIATKNPNALSAVLSQTTLFDPAHISGPSKERVVADLDANGWPQAGRNKFVERLIAANAIHLCGDQHLSTVVEHFVDSAQHGAWEFSFPAIANNYYNRWWQPLTPSSDSIKTYFPETPYLGSYSDGFGNPIKMHAYANPNATDNGAGFGVITFYKQKGEIKLECWPRFQNLSGKSAKQFTGWPVKIITERDRL